MSSTTSTSLSKAQKYLLNSKTWRENSAELTKLCLEMSKGDIKFTTMLVHKYTSFVLDWLEEDWDKCDFKCKEEVLEGFTAGGFIEKLHRDNPAW